MKEKTVRPPQTTLGTDHNHEQRCLTAWPARRSDVQGPVTIHFNKGLIMATKTKDSESRDRRAIVIGAGAAGVCTAHELADQGYKVVVLDAAPSVSTECSAAPAGGMQRYVVLPAARLPDHVAAG